MPEQKTKVRRQTQKRDEYPFNSPDTVAAPQQLPEYGYGRTSNQETGQVIVPMVLKDRINAFLNLNEDIFKRKKVYRVYLRPGEQPPKGHQLLWGEQNKPYYETEERLPAGPEPPPAQPVPEPEKEPSPAPKVDLDSLKQFIDGLDTDSPGRSVNKLENYLSNLDLSEDVVTGYDDVINAIEEFRGMQRSDYDDAEEYRDARQESFEEILDMVRDFEIVEEEAETGETKIDVKDVFKKYPKAEDVIAAFPKRFRELERLHRVVSKYELDKFGIPVKTGYPGWDQARMQNRSNYIEAYHQAIWDIAEGGEEQPEKKKVEEAPPPPPTPVPEPEPEPVKETETVVADTIDALREIYPDPPSLMTAYPGRFFELEHTYNWNTQHYQTPLEGMTEPEQEMYRPIRENAQKRQNYLYERALKELFAEIEKTKEEEKPPAPADLEIFDKTTTPYPQYDKMIQDPEFFRRVKNRSFEIEQMHPREAIAQSRHYHFGPEPKVSEEEIQMISHDILDGATYPLPVIDEEGHEGLGRISRPHVLAAERLGIPSIPVMKIKEHQPDPPLQMTVLPDGGVKVRMYRGLKESKPGQTYSTDPGDLGAGIYWHTDKAYARSYAQKDLLERKATFKNPLIIGKDERTKWVQQIERKYKTVTGTDQERIEGAHRLTSDLVAQGHDALIIEGYEGGPDHYTIVDFSPFFEEKSQPQMTEVSPKNKEWLQRKVHHPKYGKGTVIRAIGKEPSLYVQFESGKYRWITKKEAKEPIGLFDFLKASDPTAHDVYDNIVDFITKARKKVYRIYLDPGEQPPPGRRVLYGKQGEPYYETQERLPTVAREWLKPKPEEPPPPEEPPQTEEFPSTFRQGDISIDEARKIPSMSPDRARIHGEEVPRYYYHVPGKEKVKEGIRSYPIRETQAADSFGPGYEKGSYVWLGAQPIGGGALKVDLTRLDNANLRFTGQAEGHLLHRGDIPESAIVRDGKDYMAQIDESRHPEYLPPLNMLRNIPQPPPKTDIDVLHDEGWVSSKETPSYWDDVLRPLETTPQTEDVPLGSNPGGIYHNTENGLDYYVKFIGRDRAAVEVFSTSIYKITHVDVPDSYSARFKGKDVLITRWVDGDPFDTTDMDDQGIPKEAQARITRGVFIDAWLGNTDIGENARILYTEYRNKPPKITRVDMGGTLYYDHEGNRKEFTDEVPELDIMIDHDPLYSQMDNPEEAIWRLSMLNDHKIKSLVELSIINEDEKESLTKTLIARRNYILDWYNEKTWKKKTRAQQVLEQILAPSKLTPEQEERMSHYTRTVPKDHDPHYDNFKGYIFIKEAVQNVMKDMPEDHVSYLNGIELVVTSKEGEKERMLQELPFDPASNAKHIEDFMKGKVGGMYAYRYAWIWLVHGVWMRDPKKLLPIEKNRAQEIVIHELGHHQTSPRYPQSWHSKKISDEEWEKDDLPTGTRTVMQKIKYLYDSRKARKASTPTHYAEKNEDEWFAEIYAYYRLYPSLLKIRDLKAYNTLRDHVFNGQEYLDQEAEDIKAMAEEERTTTRKRMKLTPENKAIEEAWDAYMDKQFGDYMLYAHDIESDNDVSVSLAHAASSGNKERFAKLYSELLDKEKKRRGSGWMKEGK